MIKKLGILTVMIVFGLAMALPSQAFDQFDLGDINFEGGTVHYFSNVDHIEAAGLEYRKEAAEEKFNVNIEFQVIDRGVLEETVMSRLLSGDSKGGDIYRINNTFFWNLVPQGGVYPAGDVLPSGYYDALPSTAQMLAQEMVYRGTNYGFAAAPGAIFANMNLIGWNQDLFEREGLPDLYEVYDEEEWTWEKMTEIAVQATKDTSGDGEIDQWGMTSPDEIALAYTNDASVTRVDADGNIIFTFDEEAALEALTQSYEWRENYNVVGGGRGDFADGRVAMYRGSGWTFGTGEIQEMEDDYGIVPLPMGPEANTYRYPARGWSGWMIGAGAEYPEGVITVHNYIFSRDVYDEDIERRLYTYARDRKSVEVMEVGLESWSGEVDHHYPIVSGVLAPAISEVRSGEKGAATAMAEIQAQAQSLLDELFDQ